MVSTKQKAYPAPRKDGAMCASKDDASPICVFWGVLPCQVTLRRVGVSMKGGGVCHGLGRCNLSFGQIFNFEQFSQRVLCGATGQEVFFAPPKGSRVILCCHKAAGFFCGTTEQQYCHGTAQFLLFWCCHLVAGLYLNCHRVVFCCGAGCVPAFCIFFLLCVKCKSSKYPS